MNEHVPPLHSAVALATDVVHGVEQAPQLLRLVAVFTQVPLHSKGAAAGQVHVELTHVCPVAQAEPHAPQLLLLVAKSTHAPLQRE